MRVILKKIKTYLIRKSNYDKSQIFVNQAFEQGINE